MDNGDGTYTFSFNATRSTTNYIWTTYAIAGGLQVYRFRNVIHFAALLTPLYEIFRQHTILAPQHRISDCLEAPDMYKSIRQSIFL